MSKYLIINADDYGLCPSVNEGIEQLFEIGTITSTTIMTPAPAAKEGILRALANPRIMLGVHLTLNAEYSALPWGPVSPAEQVPSLVNEEGYFYPSITPLLRKAQGAEVSREFEAQYHFITSLGVTPTHADNHMFSVYGVAGRSFLPETLTFCSAHGLAFRLPKDPSCVSEAGWGKGLDVAGMLDNAVRYAANIGVPLPDRTFSNSQSVAEIGSYQQIKQFYLGLIENLGEGVTEIFLHPARATEEFKALCPDWQKRAWEYEFLIDRETRDALAGISLVSWKQLGCEI